MKLFWVALLLITLVLGVTEALIFMRMIWGPRKVWDLYERWRSHHTVISKSLDEKHKRFNVFKENVTHVHTTNRMDKPYKLKMNKLADMTK